MPSRSALARTLLLALLLAGCTRPSSPATPTPSEAAIASTPPTPDALRLDASWPEGDSVSLERYGEVSFQANVSDATAPLASVEWRQDGTLLSTRACDGSASCGSMTDTLSTRFDAPGSFVVTFVATGAHGGSVSRAWNVTVADAPAVACPATSCGWRVDRLDTWDSTSPGAQNVSAKAGDQVALYARAIPLGERETALRQIVWALANGTVLRTYACDLACDGPTRDALLWRFEAPGDYQVVATAWAPDAEPLAAAWNVTVEG